MFLFSDGELLDDPFLRCDKAPRTLHRLDGLGHFAMTTIAPFIDVDVDVDVVSVVVSSKSPNDRLGLLSKKGRLNMKEKNVFTGGATCVLTYNLLFRVNCVFWF